MGNVWLIELQFSRVGDVLTGLVKLMVQLSSALKIRQSRQFPTRLHQVLKQTLSQSSHWWFSISFVGQIKEIKISRRCSVGDLLMNCLCCSEVLQIYSFGVLDEHHRPPCICIDFLGLRLHDTAFRNIVFCELGKVAERGWGHRVAGPPLNTHYWFGSIIICGF